MNRYPDKDQVIEVLSEVAWSAALDSTARHPEDIAAAMSSAIEAGGVAVQVMHELQNGTHRRR